MKDYKPFGKLWKCKHLWIIHRKNQGCILRWWIHVDCNMHLSGMQSAQRTLCRQVAPSSCAPLPAVGPGAALERRRAAEWPSLPFCPGLSSDSAQTPAAGTYQSPRNDRPARPYGGSRCLVKITRNEWLWKAHCLKYFKRMARKLTYPRNIAV